MPKTINPPHLRQLAAMAGASNQTAQLLAGMSQAVFGSLLPYPNRTEKEEEEGKPYTRSTAGMQVPQQGGQGVVPAIRIGEILLYKGITVTEPKPKEVVKTPTLVETIVGLVGLDSAGNVRLQLDDTGLRFWNAAHTSYSWIAEF